MAVNSFDVYSYTTKFHALKCHVDSAIYIPWTPEKCTMRAANHSARSKPYLAAVPTVLVHCNSHCHSSSNIQGKDIDGYAKSWVSHINSYGTGKAWCGGRCRKPTGAAINVAPSASYLSKFVEFNALRIRLIYTSLLSSS